MTTRRSIKEGLVNTLKGETTARDSVHASRSIPTDIDKLPTVLIYIKSESIEIFNESPREYKRIATITIECIDTGDDDDSADNNVELLAKQVEDNLGLDETFGDLVDDSELVSINFQNEPDGQSPVAAAVITLNATYYTDASPKSDAADFLRFNTDWQVGHDNESSDEIIDAQDEATIPQE